jgi:glycosyltransferase involved in cell wall biosynthesis
MDQKFWTRQSYTDHENLIMLKYTVVMPCLNEELTLERCINEAKSGAILAGAEIEIIIADNGSTDNSKAIARKLGCKVVEVPIKGYGAALDAGIKAATNSFIVMGDSDLSYSFEDAPKFVKSLVEGADIVVGNRFEGGIHPGAMPWHHKYIGNPVLSLLGRLFFSIPIKDFHCGLRAVRKEKYIEANPVTTGMEFATEMIARLANIGATFVEIPTQLRRDGRDRKPHLRSFPDGWRHLKMMLLFSPQYFQLLPGILLSVIGVFGLASFAATGKINLLFAEGSLQTALFSTVFLILGTQMISASFVTMAYATSKNVVRFKPWDSIQKVVTSKSFLTFSLIISLLSFASLFSIGSLWLSANFPAVDPLSESRRTLPIISSLIVGVQGMMCSVQTRQILSKFW